MDSPFQGHRFTAQSLRDKTNHSGLVRKVAGDVWALEGEQEPPRPGEALLVTFIGDGVSACARGQVVAKDGLNFVLKCSSLTENRNSARYDVTGIKAIWNSPGGAIKLDVSDVSQSGFGFCSPVEIPPGTVGDFHFSVKARLETFRGQVAHVRRDDDGLWRGGVKLLVASRLIHVLLSSGSKAAS